MPTFLSDPPLAVYLVLFLALLVGGGVWLRTRKKPYLIATIILAGLLVAVVLCGIAFESPREESARRVAEMAAALSAKDWNKFADHVSESFDHKGIKKKDLKKGFDLGTQYGITATAWDFKLAEGTTPTDTRIELEFEGKATAATGEPLLKHFRATFVKDPDGKFRMTGFTPYNYVQKKVEEPIPGLP